jgi:hypothetical protein
MATEKMDIIVTLKDHFSKGLKLIDKSLGRMKSTLSKLSNTVFSLRGAFVALGATAIAYSFTRTAVAFEKYGAILKTITGSATKAQESMAWVTEFAAKTPYELDQVTGAFVKLKSYGFDPTTGSLKILGDTAAGMGKDLMQAVEMFADAATGEFERIKEFGVKAKQQGDKVTFSWNQNGQQMTKTAKKTSSEITKALLEIFSAKYAGAMEGLSKTFGGMWSNIQDHFTQFQQTVMSAGIFDYMKAGLSTVLNKINELKDSGKLDEWAQKVSDGVVTSFKAIAIGAAKAYDALGPLLRKIGEELKALDAWMQLFGIIFSMPRGRTDVEKQISNITRDIKELEAELEKPVWQLNIFKGMEYAEGIPAKLEHLRAKLKELQDQGSIGEVIDGDKIQEDAHVAENAMKNFFEEVEKTGEETGGFVERWLRKSAADFLKFGADISKAAVDAKIKYFDSLDGMIEKTQRAYDKIKAEVDSYAKKVIAAEEAIHLIRMSTADKIRALQRKTMTDAAAYADEERQAAEKLAAAKKAFAEDDIKLAKRLAQEAESLYAGLAREVTKDVGGESVVTQSMEASVKIATNGINEVGNLEVQIVEKQKDMYEKLGSEASKKMDEVKGELDELTADRDLLIGIKLEALIEAQNKIKDLTKDEVKKITIEITKKEVGSTGMQRGGVFSGYGGGDQIPVLAEAGEGFVRKEAIRKYGKNFFNAYNSLSIPVASVTKALKARIGGIMMPDLTLLQQRFQGGGIASTPSVKDMGIVELRVGSRGYPVMGSPNVLSELKAAINRENLLRSN